MKNGEGVDLRRTVKLFSCPIQSGIDYHLSSGALLMHVTQLGSGFHPLLALTVLLTICWSSSWWRRSSWTLKISFRINFSRAAASVIICLFYMYEYVKHSPVWLLVIGNKMFVVLRTRRSRVNGIGEVNSFSPDHLIAESTARAIDM